MRGGAQVWRLVAGGIALRVRLTPRAAADAVAGVGETAEGPALLVRVRAVPAEGEANAAAAAVVARWLGLPAGKVAVAKGHKSRVKMLEIAGAPDVLEALVAARVGVLG